MTDDLNRLRAVALTDDERAQIKSHLPNLYIRVSDNARGCVCGGHGEHLIAAVESIVAARTAALLAENERLRDELERAYAFGTDSGL